MLLFILLFLTLNSQVTIYFYDIRNNSYVPKDCIVNNLYEYLECYCDCTNTCIWGWNIGDIARYVTFNQPRSSARDISIYGYYINTGIINFKLNSKECTNYTCYPTVNYMVNPRYGTFTIDLICTNYH